MSKYISIKEAADLLGVGTQTMRNWEKKGQLIPYRNPINNYRRYKLSQIESFMEEMRNDRMRRSKFKIRVKIEEEE